MKPSVVIVGAGVVGLSLSWHLVKAGAAVTVLASPDDREEIGWATMAWSNASSKVRRSYPDHYARLNVRGVQAGRELAREIGGGWLATSGAVEIVSGSEQSSRLAQDVDRLHRELGYPSELLTRGRVLELAPNVILRRDETAALFSRDAVIDAPVLLQRLATVVREAGGRIVHERVIAIDRSNELISAVQLGEGTQLTADFFVIAAGAQTGRIADLAGVAVPMLSANDPRVPGLVAATSFPALPFGPMLLTPEVILRPGGPGRALLGSDLPDRDVTADSSRAELSVTAAAWLERARARMPVLASAAVVDVRVGIRALSEDGLTIAGRAPGITNLYVLTTHSGFTLAPLLGRLVSNEIVRGELEPDLQPYRLERFEHRVSR